VQLIQILIFAATATLIGMLGNVGWRRWLLLVASVIAVYWLQSTLPIRHLDFWLPTATLVMTVLVWAVTRPSDAEPVDQRETLIAGGVIAGIVILLAFTRFVEPLAALTASRPPQVYQVAIVLAIGIGFILAALYARSRGLSLAAGGLLVAILVILKLPSASVAASHILRTINNQAITGASALDLGWLGFSYIAFRLLHTILDRWNGRLPSLSLIDFVIYVIFFPALTAGPIDRVERFSKDLSASFRLNADALLSGSKRIVLGLFMKFVLADLLALISLDGVRAAQIHQAGWLWLLVYAYAFRLFFDFAGYTHITIGIGQLAGITLPENFDKPYLKGNLTTFWNSWHITLAMWFRAYYFNPVSRALRPRHVPIPVIIAFTQLTTMLLIGLWHGITWNFAIWGLWHGVGLFINNRWQNATRARMRRWNENPRLKPILSVAGVLVTFHYVALGWVWFALPDLSLSVNTFLGLFGVTA